MHRLINPLCALVLGLVLTGSPILAQEAAKAKPGEGDPPVVRDPASNPRPQNRGGFGGAREPRLLSELRFKPFADKLKLTKEQQDRVNALQNELGEYFRTRILTAPVTSDEQQKVLQAKIKDAEEKAVQLLTPEQKIVWEEYKVEVSRDGRGFEPRPRDSQSAADQERIRALEAEVKLLKEEIARLKAAIKP